MKQNRRAARGENDVGFSLARSDRPFAGRGRRHEQSLELVGACPRRPGRGKRSAALRLRDATPRCSTPSSETSRRRETAAGSPEATVRRSNLADAQEEAVARRVAAEEARQAPGPALEVCPAVALVVVAGPRRARPADRQRLAAREGSQRAHGLADRGLLAAGHEGEPLVPAETPARRDAVFTAHPHVADVVRPSTRARPRAGVLRRPRRARPLREASGSSQRATAASSQCTGPV